MENATTAIPTNVSKYARRTFFLLIVLQVPLFRVQCGSGMCTTPVQVTSSALISSDVFPLPVVKSLLYPGAIVNGLINDKTFPSWNNLLSIYNVTYIKEASAVTDLPQLEVFPLASHHVNEGILRKPVNADPKASVFVYPMMLIAFVCASLSIPKPLKSSSKSKLKWLRVANLIPENNAIDLTFCQLVYQLLS